VAEEQNKAVEIENAVLAVCLVEVELHVAGQRSRGRETRLGV
jgi:hypothetical protein